MPGRQRPRQNRRRGFYQVWGEREWAEGKGKYQEKGGIKKEGKGCEKNRTLRETPSEVRGKGFGPSQTRGTEIKRHAERTRIKGQAY